MPNKLRLKELSAITEALVDSMSEDELRKSAYYEVYNYLDEIDILEVEEIYEALPEILYKPTLSEMIDKIWINLASSYETPRICIPTHHELHNQNARIKIELWDIVGRTLI